MRLFDYLMRNEKEAAQSEYFFTRLGNHTEAAKWHEMRWLWMNAATTAVEKGIAEEEVRLEAVR